MYLVSLCCQCNYRDYIHIVMSIMSSLSLLEECKYWTLRIININALISAKVKLYCRYVFSVASFDKNLPGEGTFTPKPSRLLPNKSYAHLFLFKHVFENIDYQDGIFSLSWIESRIYIRKQYALYYMGGKWRRNLGLNSPASTRISRRC